MTAPSDKTMILSRNVPESNPINNNYPSLHFPRSRIKWASVLTTLTLFWGRRCMGTDGKDLKAILLIRVVSARFLTCVLNIFSMDFVSFDYLLFLFHLIKYHRAIIFFKIAVKHARNSIIDSYGSHFLPEGFLRGSFHCTVAIRWTDEATPPTLSLHPDLIHGVRLNRSIWSRKYSQTLSYFLSSSLTEIFQLGSRPSKWTP